MAQDNNMKQKNREFYLYINGKKINLKPFLVILFLPIILPLIISISANIITNIFFSSSNTNYVEEEIFYSKINEINTNLGNINTTLLAVNGRLNTLENLNNSNPQIQLEGDNNTIIVGLKPIDNNTLEIYQETKYLAYVAAAPSWISSDIIARDSETGHEYTAAELVDQKILFSYELDNKEYYFCGQYNEDNQWDGNCITNVYEDNILISVMDAEYQNGKLYTYKQAIKVSVNSGMVWAISNRKTEKDQKTGESYTTGETWNYFYNNCEYNKLFDTNTVAYEDIITITDFNDYITERTSLEGYYNGRTSNGLYNDKTGNAYMARYFEDGTIRTLYVGNFVNGDPNDSSDNAWSIAYTTEGGYYVHNNKGFKGGNAIIKSTKPIDINEINDIISGYNFNCVLNWR